MPGVPLHLLLGQIQRIADPPGADSAPDRVLLEQFIAHRDEDAFATLVRRHGPMVLGVCRSMLRQADDAEDAFQATFLVLARKAGSIRKPESVASWLHGVAHGLARNVQAGLRRRRFHERRAPAMPDPDPLLDLTVRELQCVVSEELQRLPEQYRSVLVLCCLEGKNPDEAARLLGCSAGALRGRLNRGRAALRQRLARRGIALSPASFGTALPGGSSPVAGRLVEATVQAAVHYAAGGRIAGELVSTQVARLAEGAVKGMLSIRLLAVGTVVAALVLAAVGAGAVIQQTPLAGEPEGRSATERPAGDPAATDHESKPRTDPEGDPLPRDALARLGTTRFRQGGHIDHLVFTPDGKVLISSSAWDRIRLWDAATGKEARRWPDATPARAIALSPNGKLLAALTSANPPAEGGVALRELATGRLVRRFGKAESFSQLRFSPDGKVLAVFGWEKKIELWDPEAGRLLHTLTGHQDIVWSADFSADGKTLVSGSDDKTIRFWNVATGEQVRQIAHKERVGQVALSPDGKLLASVDVHKEEFQGGASWTPDHRVRLWRADTGAPLRELALPPAEWAPGHRIGIFSMAFAPDGRLLTGNIVDGGLRVWDPATGRELRRIADLAGTVGPLAFTPDGTGVAVGHGSATICVLDLASGKQRVALPGHASYVASLAVTPDGRTVVTAGGDDTVRFWDPATGRELRRRTEDGMGLQLLQILPDGRSYLVGGRDDRVRICDLATGKERAVLHGLSASQVFALAPDQQVVAVWGADKNVHLLDVSTGKSHHTLDRTEERPAGMAFSDDGRLLVVWNADRNVTVWDAHSGKKQRQFAGPVPLIRDPVPVNNGHLPYTAALSPDGDLLAFGFQGSGAPQGMLPVVETATGKVIARFPTAKDGVCQLRFSPDGRSLAWAGWQEGTVYVGEVATGRERHHFTGHRGRVASLAFSADGTLLLSGGEDTTALVWDLTGRRTTGSARAEPLSKKELKDLWTTLANADAGAGYRALQTLATDPAHAVPYLGEHMYPVPVVDEKRLKELVAALDSARFEVREQAAADLEKLGESALHVLRKALEGRPTLEARRRLESLIARQERGRWAPDRLRTRRALEVLERIGSPDARRVLQKLARGAPEGWLTEEANRALARLASRS